MITLSAMGIDLVRKHGFSEDVSRHALVETKWWIFVDSRDEEKHLHFNTVIVHYTNSK